MIGMLLTKLLAGSLIGSALIGMITCISQSERRRDLPQPRVWNHYVHAVNRAEPQPAKPIKELLAAAQKKHAEAAAVVAKGVMG